MADVSSFPLFSSGSSSWIVSFAAVMSAVQRDIWRSSWDERSSSAFLAVMSQRSFSEVAAFSPSVMSLVISMYASVNSSCKRWRAAVQSITLYLIPAFSTAAGHGRINEAALLCGMYGVGDFAGGRRVNGRAVYEEAIGVGDDGFGERGLKDLPEDIVDVGGFGEDGDSCFRVLGSFSSCSR